MIHKHKIHSCNYNDCAKKNKPSGKDILHARIILEYILASLFLVSQFAEKYWQKIIANPRIIVIGFPKS